MPLKPSILKGIESILGARKVESFVSENEDFLILEDNSGRVRISNRSNMLNYSPSHYISGIIAAVKGRLDDKGVFSIEDICFYNNSGNLASIKTIQPSRNDLFEGSNKLIAFISGLQFGMDKDNYVDIGKGKILRNLLLETFQGTLNNINFKINLFKRIENVVICGNIIYSPEETDQVEKGSYLKTELNNRIYRIILQNYTEADNYIASLCNCVNVHLMPGYNDNSCSFFPQSAISSILFPNSSLYDSFNLVTNPYKFKLDNKLYIGTSGQNIDNIKKYTSISNSSVDILEKTLEWGHIAPSAPDTLRTFPFTETDPMLLKETPDIYFAGNQKSFETRLIEVNGKSIRLISIPEFCENGNLVLLDTITYDTQEYKFKVLSA
jgi:DNA polymerase delta subunit 2